jgi:hypothetical protein
MPKVTVIVGGSMGCAGMAVSISSAQSVSATVALVMPARVTMSPASASSIGSGQAAEGQDLGDAELFDPLAGRATAP